MLTALVGFGLLALDGARFMSLQTQMQAAADALALAGARELNQQSGAQTRAINAMANSYGSATVPNTLSGMGSTPTLTYTYTFYKSLPAASAGLTGTAAAGDADSKYVQVTVNTVSVPTIFPVSFVKAGASNNFAAGASAIAGFTGILVCGVTPIFICNPYENAGDSDAQATQELYAAYKDAATLRKMFRMDRSSTSPGHFGWVQTADGCNDTNCMRQNIAQVSGACYNSYNVQLAIGNKNSAEPYFDTRFDIYNAQNPKVAITSTNAPAINVRKGYNVVADSPNKAIDWCSATPGNPYITIPPASVAVTGTTTENSTTISNVSNFSGYAVGYTIAGASIPSGTMITATNPGGNQLTISAKATATQSGEALTLSPSWSGLPQDEQWTGLCSSGTCVQGNGDWDCADYWSINHMAAAPAGCTSSNPTISRYQVYRYEIANGLIADWSKSLADTQGTKNPPGNYFTEAGGPYCAGSNGVAGVDITTGGLDRRNIIVPIINCLAQTELGNITGGNTANVPVAAFGKFFLTQPFSVDGLYLYGEMTGLTRTKDNVVIYNQVELYR
jgi:hypothetical protein